MGMGDVPIRAETLRWAMRWSGLEANRLAEKVGVKPEKVSLWLQEQEKPTYAQAWKLARALHLGLAELLLPPREAALPVRDFRRNLKGPSPSAEAAKTPSPELLEAVYDALRKRDWLRNRRKTPLDFVGSGKDREALEVAQEMATRIRPERFWAKGVVEDYLRALTKEVEELGILVLRQGQVGNDSYRPYKPEEFSGFAVVDRVAPVILINTKDHPTRQVFTLAHELAHVWWGEGGVEGGLEEVEPRDEVEVWADEVAANFLMPTEPFRKVWEKTEDEPLAKAREAADFFKVSPRAALLRAKKLGLLSPEEYLAALDRHQESSPRPRKEEGGGNFWFSLEVRNSPAFMKELRRAAQEGEVDAKEVAILLGLSLRTAWKWMSGEVASPSGEH
jgi:Zn-dependent peptidase ImmA (M78 family)